MAKIKKKDRGTSTLLQESGTVFFMDCFSKGICKLAALVEFKMKVEL